MGGELQICYNLIVAWLVGTVGNLNTRKLDRLSGWNFSCTVVFDFSFLSMTSHKAFLSS